MFDMFITLTHHFASLNERTLDFKTTQLALDVSPKRHQIVHGPFGLFFAMGFFCIAILLAKLTAKFMPQWRGTKDTKLKANSEEVEPEQLSRDLLVQKNDLTSEPVVTNQLQHRNVSIVALSYQNAEDNVESDCSPLTASSPESNKSGQSGKDIRQTRFAYHFLFHCNQSHGQTCERYYLDSAA